MKLLNTPNKRIVVAGILLAISIVLLVMYNNHTPSYIHNTGYIFGTTYSIQYESEQDIEQTIIERLKQVDNALSMFNSNSTISKINDNSDLIVNDRLFIRVFEKSEQISALSNGAFDITVAPLVNAWGFGKGSHSDIVETPNIDEIMQYVGYNKIQLCDNTITKADPRITLDASAIAKGFGCDVVAELFKEKGIKNYLIEIGGEIVSEGVNAQERQWNIGISTPEDDPSGTNREIQLVISGNISIATSGNYRQYYESDGKRISHTIDPRTGYPADNGTLSVTIITTDCMTADALATTCMVLEQQDAINLIQQLPNTEAYIIYRNQDNQIKTTQTTGFSKYIVR